MKKSKYKKKYLSWSLSGSGSRSLSGSGSRSWSRSSSGSGAFACFRSGGSK